MRRRRPLLVTDLQQPERRSFLKKSIAFLAGGALFAGAGARPARASSIYDPTIGEISMFAGNFAPRNWAFCDGALLPIANYQALFSILGTTYGGDGRTTFALPDLRGRFPMHEGAGPGLSPRTLGQKSGEENVTMTTAQMPSHNHALRGQSSNGTSDVPTGNMVARDPAGTPGYGDGAADVVSMHGTSIGNTGGGTPQNNMPPFLVINFIIALNGVYPSRS